MLTTTPTLPAAPDAARQTPPEDRAVQPSPALSPADRRVRMINLLAILLPFAGVIGAAVATWGWGFDPTSLVLVNVFGWGTAIGITIGYHRLFTHRAFRSPAWVRYALGALGSMAVQGPVIEWAATHRRHHQHADSEDDPHSPHHHGSTTWKGSLGMTARGFVHAHFGWLLAGRPKGSARYTRDLRDDPATVAVDRHFRAWVLVGLVAPALIGGIVTLSWWGALLGFVWGGLVRIFLVHHVTWSINSVCHLWGSRPFGGEDESRNNALFGVLALGEGWHNNHHAFPSSARHGLGRWQLDISYLLIRLMAVCGLARDINIPSQARIEARYRQVRERTEQQATGESCAAAEAEQISRE